MNMNKLSQDQQEAFNNLTRLQQRVCIGVLSGMTQVDAYRAAGGKAKTDTSVRSSASEIMTKPVVRAYMDSVMQDRAVDSIADRTEILEKLTEYVRLEPGDNIDKFAVIRIAQEAIKQLRAIQGWDAAQHVDVTGNVEVDINPELLARKLVFMLDNGTEPIDLLPAENDTEIPSGEAD
jgi:hypothetical protein